jgi:hypothetical protein
MVRSSKKKAGPRVKATFSLFDNVKAADVDDENELPKDQMGREKIKKQYVDLLGIRMDKLKGRILNRERIDKTQEGIYFICSKCARVCHNLDEGLVEDEDNIKNICTACHTVAHTALKAAPRSRKKTRRKA